MVGVGERREVGRREAERRAGVSEQASFPAFFGEPELLLPGLHSLCSQHCFPPELSPSSPRVIYSNQYPFPAILPRDP